MNQKYGNWLFRDGRNSFSRRSLRRSLCYAILLIAVSSISWVPEGKCQGSPTNPCPTFYPHTDRTNGWIACWRREVRAQQCGKDTACIKKAQCETCKCGAINITGSNRYRRPWVLDDYSRACKPKNESEKDYVEELEEAYRTHMGW
jgi:hypothetical protein